MKFKEETDTLNKIPIRDVAGRLGLELPPQRMMLCPFDDHDDRNPSFEIKVSNNRWKCYGCNRSGGSIDFVKTYKSLGFLEAKNWLAASIATKASNSTTPRTHTLNRDVKPYEKDGDVEVLPDYEVYEKLLQMSKLQNNGLDYLIKRNISRNTIDTFGIGQLTNQNTITSKLIRRFGFPRVNHAGLLTKKSTSHNICLLFPNGSLLFPFYEKGRVAYLQARMIKETYSTGKWRNLNHHKHRIYNVDVLFDDKANILAVCEGVLDTLSAIEIGYNSAIGLMGTSAPFPEEQLKLLRGKEVHILLDWDSPGEAKSSKLQQEMRRLGISSIRKNRPSEQANDLNEYLMERRVRGQ